MSAYILVSALVGDRVDGIEVSDPKCPIDLRDHPDAMAWAEGQGYGPDNPDELVYVQRADEADVPAGFESYRLEVPKAGRPRVGPALNIRLPEETIAHLDVIAGLTQQSRTALIRHYVLTCLQETGWWWQLPNGQEIMFGKPGHHVAQHEHMQGVPYAVIGGRHAEVAVAGLEPVDVDENYRLADRYTVADREAQRKWAEGKLDEFGPIDPAICDCKQSMA